jgi:lipoprotein-releasing system permease protein
VLTGDKIALIAPQGIVTPAGVVPRLKQFTVAGTFDVGFNEADSGLALIHLEDAQKLYQLEDRVSGVRLKLHDLFEAGRVGRELMAKLPRLYAFDWTSSHPNLFRAVQIEKRMMFIILTLIIAVATFNVVSTLVMLVTDKQADIAILRTLGAAPGSILRIFVVQGAVIGVFGTLLGVVGGVLLAFNVETVVPALETALGFKFLNKDVYLIPDLPSEVHLEDVVGIAVISLVLAFLATLYPSWRASKVNPAEALRYE